MTWLATVFVGFLTAIIGAFGAGGLGILCVEWYRVSGREGGSGFMVMFMGLFGGVIGCVVGLICGRIVAASASPGFLKGLGVAAGTSVGLLLVVTLICWLAADLDTTIRGRPVVLQAEIRCAPGFVIPADAKDDKWYAHIDTRSRRVTSRSALRLAEARQEAGRWIIPMTLDLNTSVREKLLYVRLAETTELFIPIIPSKPGSRYQVWSEWIDGGWSPDQPRPAPDQRPNLRFRVDIVESDETSPALPAGPSYAEIEANQSDQTARLEALTPDSSLEECLKFTHYSQAAEDRQKAGAIIARRPEVAAELSAQILSAEKEAADRALRALDCIDPLPAELAVPVKAIGEKIIEDLQKFNASKPEDDPSYQGAADISELFAGWFQAHRALHDNVGVDGIPQLRRILDLALQRPDSYVLKNDVSRIAEHYVKEWTALKSPRN